MFMSSSQLKNEAAIELDHLHSKDFRSKIKQDKQDRKLQDMQDVCTSLKSHGQAKREGSQGVPP